jgi:hypothetical protein
MKGRKIMMNALKKCEEIFVNEEKKTVTVKATVSWHDFDNCKCARDCIDSKYAFPFFNYPIEFVGVARFKSDDEYDIKKATYVAESKMERQFHKFICRFYFNVAVSAFEDAIKYLGFAKEASHNIDKTDDHIKEITGSENARKNISVRKTILDRSEDIFDFIENVLEFKRINLEKKKANTNKDNS